MVSQTGKRRLQGDMDKKTWNNNKIQTKGELDRMHANEEVVRGLTGKLSPSSWKIGVGACVKPHSNTSGIGRKRRNRSLCSCGSTTPLRSRRHGRIVRVTGVLQWVERGSLGRACAQGMRWEKWGAVVLYVREQQQRRELCPGTEHKLAEGLRCRARAQADQRG